VVGKVAHGYTVQVSDTTMLIGKRLFVNKEESG